MLRYNFYTNRYWITLYEFVVAVMKDPIPNQYAERLYYGNQMVSTYDGGLLELLKRTQYKFSQSGSIFIPIFQNCAFVTKVSNEYKLKDFAYDIFMSILTRYKEEYVFDLSEKIYTEDEWYDKPSSFTTIDLPIDHSPLYPLSNDGKTEFYREARKFTTKLIEILNHTYERYALILKTYADNKADLLNKVESLTRFNDTPQDTGEFSDDEHTTHITSTKNDFDTLMGRIDEIDRKYRNVLADWTREFESLFIHEESL